MKIALFHPWINLKGGAEKLILEYIKNSKNKIDLYTWVYDKENTFEEFKNYNIIELCPKLRILYKYSIFRGLLFIFSALFSKIPLDNYDLFLISSGGFAETITFRNYKKGKTFLYCHTILRAAYEEDIEFKIKSKFKRKLYSLMANLYQKIENKAWKNINCVIFNSELSMLRAKRHNLLKNKKFYIVYPGFNLKTVNTKKSDNYFIYVARFNLAKRQDLLLSSWEIISKKYPNYKLYLIGSMSDKRYFNKIKNLSKELTNIYIMTDISNKKLESLYENCCATIFPAFAEDFGIVPFEGLAKGKPLIASEYGGYFELLKDSPGTIFFKDYKDISRTSIELINGIEKFINKKELYLNKTCDIINYIKKIKNTWIDFTNNLDYILKEGKNA